MNGYKRRKFKWETKHKGFSHKKSMAIASFKYKIPRER